MRAEEQRLLVRAIGDAIRGCVGRLRAELVWLAANSPPVPASSSSSEDEEEEEEEEEGGYHADSPGRRKRGGGGGGGIAFELEPMAEPMAEPSPSPLANPVGAHDAARPACPPPPPPPDWRRVLPAAPATGRMQTLPLPTQRAGGRPPQSSTQPALASDAKGGAGQLEVAGSVDGDAKGGSVGGRGGEFLEALLQTQAWLLSAQ